MEAARRRLAELNGWKVETIDVPEDGGYHLSRITYNGKEAAPIGRCGSDGAWRYLLEKGGQVPEYLQLPEGSGHLLALADKLNARTELNRHHHMYYCEITWSPDGHQWYVGSSGQDGIKCSARALATAIISAADGVPVEIIEEVADGDGSLR